MRVLLILAMGLLVVSQVAKTEDSKPNVLFISVDDLNDWVGYTGRHKNTLTPNIDALAARGVAFTQAFSQYPVCKHSRASMFSGLIPSTLGDVKNDADVAKKAGEHNTPLLHNYFANNGYKTMAVGKLLHRHVPKGSVDMSGDRGDWDTMPDGKEVNFVSKDTLTDWAVYPAPEEEMTDHLAAKWAVERLGEDHDKPFMLMVGFLRPHVPWYVPQKYFDAIGSADSLAMPPYKKDDLDDISQYAIDLNTKETYPKTEWAKAKGVWKDMVHAYLASINFADHYVGQVLDALKNSPYADNTIVVLVSDHGYHLGEKNTFQKQALWERANKVPIIFAGPNVPEGGMRDQTVGLIDVYPTLLELAGLPANTVNEGRSLQPVLSDADLAWDYPTISQWANGHKTDEGNITLKGQAVQLGPWRYSIYGDGSEELYNHASDPNEWTNLAAPQYAQKHRKLMDKLKAYLPTSFFTQ